MLQRKAAAQANAGRDLSCSAVSRNCGVNSAQRHHGGEATGSEAEKAQWDEVENGGRREHRDRSPGGRCAAPA